MFMPNLAGSSIFSRAKEISSPKISTNIKVGPLLHYFFVSCPKLGAKEGFEQERVIFFHPANDETINQGGITGFSEAVFGFTENFVSGKLNCKSDLPPEYEHRYITTKNYNQIMIKVERGEFTIGISLKKDKCREADYFVHLPTIKAQLVTTYQLFKLFNGTFSDLLKKGLCKNVCAQFFLNYLNIMKLNFMPLVDLFNGVDMLPVIPQLLLTVERFISHLENEFTNIDKIMFLYQDRLVWHSVYKDDLLILFTYLTKSLLSASISDELQPETFNCRRRTYKYGDGKFITGDSRTGQTPPKVFLTNKASDGSGLFVEPYYIVAFRCLNATICLFFKEEPTGDMLDKLGHYFEQSLNQLASKIGSSVPLPNKANYSEIPFHMIYYNPSTLSLSTSFNQQGENTSTMPNLTKSVLKLTCDTFDHFMAEKDEPFGHVQVKSEDGWYIYFKKFNARIVILYLYDANSTSLDKTETFAQIIKRNISNMLLD
uniref:Intu_longin_1 domain-containing protein n=1 Tax=Rhabditophanes sp. KR3021 TaxID=114890 RepID=A0AC35UBS5_9BILA